jgi:hypothetical protein
MPGGLSMTSIIASRYRTRWGRVAGSRLGMGDRVP